MIRQILIVVPTGVRDTEDAPRQIRIIEHPHEFSAALNARKLNHRPIHQI
jgi:hypothetical protein